MDDDQAEVPEAESEPKPDLVASHDDQIGATESSDGDQLSRQRSDSRYSVPELASRSAPPLDVAACIGSPSGGTDALVAGREREAEAPKR